MVIIKTKGGLGNQMFQYAFGRALSVHQNTEFALDINVRSNVKGIKTDINRPFLLDHFNIAAKIASRDEVSRLRSPFFLYLAKLWRKMTDYNYYHFDPSFLAKKGNRYFEGFWWQSEQYFKDIRPTLLQDFTLKNGFGTDAKKIAEAIRRTESPISVHARRGDYVKDPATHAHHGLATLDYYQEAVKTMCEKIPHPVFFVFSDDIEWAEQHLSFPFSAFFVSGRGISIPEELMLMSLCKHHIIANSSFSWWGAWLGTDPEKVIIAPKKWISDKTVNTKDIYPPTWIQK